MVCDTRLKPRQTIQQRKTEVIEAVKRFVKGLTSGRIRAKVSPQGAIAFDGISADDRDGVTDACAYRAIMKPGGNALAQAEIARAEALAGRRVDSKVIGAAGHHVHSHDGGKTWHTH